MTELHWWQRAVIYQIYLRSFQDSDGDGNGDLDGVRRRLDYLQWLGVDALWLSPIHPSPLVDNGYDVSDYLAVHTMLGTLEDFRRLVEEAHARDLRVILDWVPNHTAIEHPWFQAARTSREHPQRDWYIWADPAPDGGPPNNWLSVFGGSAWALDKATGQYYCHHFDQTQADLNWHNPEVRNAMLETLRFWLERGVDGFRVDATCLIVKDRQLRDNPGNPDFTRDMAPDAALTPRYTRDRPAVHEVLAEVRAVVEVYPERVLLGELYLPMEKIVHYYGERRPELHLPLNLHLAWCDWTPEGVGEVLERYRELLPEHGWPAWILSTHDADRLANRMGPAQARVAAMLGLTLPGTLSLYYGAEIGLTDIPDPPEPPVDPQGRYTGRNRDPFRAPMQWDDSRQASFTDGEPWLPLAGNQDRVSVATQRDDPHSLLSLYRRLLALRREEPVLVSGALEPVARTARCLVYRRNGEDRQLLVALNMSAKPAEVDFGATGQILLSTGLDRAGEMAHGSLELRGDEGVVVAL